MALVNTFLTEVKETIFPARDATFGPLPPLLLALTVVTGLVDSFSYLVLGHVFVANMTGNVVFLAFALVGRTGILDPAPRWRLCVAFGCRRGDRGPGELPPGSTPGPPAELVPRRSRRPFIAVSVRPGRGERHAGDVGFPLRPDRRARHLDGHPERRRPQARGPRPDHDGAHDDDHGHDRRQRPREEERGQSGTTRPHGDRDVRRRAWSGPCSSCTGRSSTPSPSRSSWRRP